MRGGLSRRLAALSLVAVLTACAATPARELGTRPPLNPYDPEEPTQFPIDVYDPWEGWNRGVYQFNARFDQFVFLPVVRAYRFVLPEFVRRRVASFFSNITEFRNATNGLLQGRPDVAGRAVTRLAINSTAGALGLFDVASRFGVGQQREDFGQTLGRWGGGAGPYMVLPVLGPSSLRDFGGLAVDTGVAYTVPPESIVTDWVYFNPAIYLLYAVDERANIEFRYYGSGSPFEYDILRYLYSRKRDFDIRQ